MQRILKEIMKKKMILGTSDAWSMRRSSHRPSDPAYYLKIVGFQFKIHEINLNILFQNKSISEKEPRVGLYQKEFGNIYSLPIARE